MKKTSDCHQPTALVYPASALAGYAIMRALGEQGVPVLALGHDRHPHMKSRWAIPVQVPRMTQDPVAFVDALNRLTHRLPQGGVLYVVEDVLLYLLHQHRHRLHPGILFPFMDDACLRGCLDKRPMLETAKQAGVPIPWTRFAPTPQSLAEEDVPLPCLIKPLVSRFSFARAGQAQDLDLFPRLFGGKCVKVSSRAELLVHLERCRQLGVSVLVQEWVPGPQSNILGAYFYADRNHRILGGVTTRKARQFPADFGNGTFRISVHSEAVWQHARRLVKALGFHGIGAVEFRLDPRDDMLKLMEINPRPGRNVGAATAFGVNVPQLQYADLAGLPIPATAQRFGVKWFDELGEWAYFQRYRHERATADGIDFWHWAGSLLGAQPAVLNWADPLPGLLQFVPKPVWQLRERFRQRPLAVADTTMS